MTTKLFGEPVRRREDARLIVGKGRYLDDIGSGDDPAAPVRGVGPKRGHNGHRGRHRASRIVAAAWWTAFLMLA